MSGGIFDPQKLSTFWLVAQQPGELWTSGDHRWIQCFKEVHKAYWPSF